MGGDLLMIGLCGYAGAGKDTVGAMLGRPTRAFADALRALALDLDPYFVTQQATYSELIARGGGYDSAKRIYPEIRAYLVKLAEKIKLRTDPSIWTTAALKDAPPDLVLTDCRCAVEADAIRARGGIICYIHRPGVEPANETERDSIAQICPDIVLVNGGTLDDLRAHIQSSNLLGARSSA